VAYSSWLEKLKSRIFIKNSEIIEVSQHEQAITNAEDKKPILATYGLAPCISFSGWSPRHRIGFMTHYDSKTELESSFEILLKNISEQLHWQSTEFETRIIGGYNYNNNSQETINFIKSKLNARPNITMKLVEERIFTREVESVLLDTITGYVGVYNPKKPVEINEDFFKELINNLNSLKTPARLIYVPGGMK